MKANSIDIIKLLIQEAIAAGITFGAATIAAKPNKSIEPTQPREDRSES